MNKDEKFEDPQFNDFIPNLDDPGLTGEELQNDSIPEDVKPENFGSSILAQMKGCEAKDFGEFVLARNANGKFNLLSASKGEVKDIEATKLANITKVEELERFFDKIDS